jgi:hypothetical protein
LISDLNSNFGPAVPPDDAIASLAAKRAQIGNELPGVWANAPRALDTSDILSSIGEGLNKARGATARVLQAAKNDLMTKLKGSEGAVPVTDPETLHNVKDAIDERINWENFQSPGSVSKSEGAAANLRDQINQLLRNNVPGYGDVMDRLSVFHRGEEGIGYGRTVLNGGPNAVWPQQLEQKLAATEPNTPGYTTTVTAGARGSIENAVGTSPNDFAALKRLLGGDYDWNRAKLARLFGQQPTENMLQAVNREQTFSDTNQAVRRNSETAARTAAAQNVSQAEMPPFSQLAAIPTLYGDVKSLAVGLGNKAYEALRGGYHGAKLNQLADVITSPDSAYRQALVRALMEGQGASGRAGQAISNTIANPALVSALLSEGRRDR